MVIELHDLVCLAAAQYLDQVIHAKALAGAVHRAEGHAGGLGAVPGVRRLKAAVAIAAGLVELVAKVIEQGLAPATGDLTQPQHGIEAMLLGPLVLLAAGRSGHHLAQLYHILQAVDHPGVGGQAIPSGPAGFLVVGLHRLGHVQVGHEAHVRFVDTHAEGNGRHHDDPLLAQEAGLVRGPGGCIQAGVVGQCVQSLLAQPGGDVLGFTPGHAVDNAGVADVLVAQEAQQLLAGVVLQGDAIADIGPVEAGDELAGVTQVQTFNDFQPGAGVGRGRQGDARNTGKARVQQAQLQVVGAEIVAPLGYAMGLVDGKQADCRLFQQ